MTYNGLKISDKDALLDAQVKGAEWIAREDSSALWGYATKPVNIDLERGFFTWSVNGLSLMLGAIPLDDCKLDFIKWNDAEPVNIDLALAQIAEMESAENPLTCDGCDNKDKFDYSREVGRQCPCTHCKRIAPDRYEPKGEPNV